MTYIGFSTKTHKFLARIFCKKFKHCAPVVIDKNKCYLYQFINRKNIAKIPLTQRDLLILEHHGWKFIKYSAKNTPRKAKQIKAMTCVQFTKRFCHIDEKRILTPDDLFRYLK